MAQFKQSVRNGLRGIRQRPAFAATVILSLALGVGLTTAVFMVADALLFRKFPVRDQDRIVVLSGAKRDGSFDNYPLSLPEAKLFAAQRRSLVATGYFAYEGAQPKSIREGDQITRLQRALVSGNYFDVLGVKPILGRALESSDDVGGAAPVVVLSYETWRDHFGGNRDILGRQLETYDDDMTYTVVGVLPQGFDFPKGANFWTSIAASTPPTRTQYVAVDVIGRLAGGRIPDDAQRELTEFLSRPEATADEHELRGAFRDFSKLILGDIRPALFAFIAACAMLLVIASMNIANLLFVRGLMRTQEMAVRAALGATQHIVIVGLLVESSVLAVIGGALGVVFAMFAVHAFVAMAPRDIPRLGEISLNATALGAAVLITGFATLLFALAPAVLTSRADIQTVLRSGGRHGPGRNYRFMTEGAVVLQVALAVMILCAAGVIMRSLSKLTAADFAFDTSNILIGQLSLRADEFDNAPKQVALLDQLLPAIRNIPGVRGASPVVAPPFAGSGGWDIRLAAEGQPTTAATPMLNLEVVAPSYFSALGIPIVAGRMLTDSDREGAPAAVIVNQSTAHQFWPNESAIGKRLLLDTKGDNALTVVGVVPDTRYRELRTPRLSVYVPLHQSFFPFAPTTLLIRTSVPPSTIVPALRRAISGVDQGAALANATPFADLLGQSLAQPRLNAMLLSMFAGSAIVLAAIGLFGVLSTAVRQRTRELSVRIALGARAVDLVRSVTIRGVVITALGLVIGTVGSLMANRSLTSILYDVSPTDPFTILVVALVLTAVACVASFLPARATTRLDGTLALRSEQ